MTILPLSRSERPFILVLLTAILFLSGCSKTPEQQLLGRWEAGFQQWEFFDDGLLVVTASDEHDMIRETWSWKIANENNRLRIGMGDDGIQMATFEVSGETLALKMEQFDQTIEFTRAGQR